MKENIILFGAGKLYKERITLLKEKYNILAIIDNNAEHITIDTNNIPIYKPNKIVDLTCVPIIIMSDFIIEIILQLSQIIGEQACNERVKIGRLCVPVSLEEKTISKENSSIKIENGEIFFISEKNTIILEKSEEYIKKLYRIITYQNSKLLQEIINMPINPIDDAFGTKRGTAIDRYYIEKFLEKNQAFIYGKCLEIAEDTYTKKYGQSKVTSSVMLHVQGLGDNVIKGNLETGENIEENDFDSMIITQTLMFIYDLKSTVKNIYKGLKNGGTALITVSGIAKIARYDDDNWGEFHSFYMNGLKKLFVPIFGEDNVQIIHYGNVKSAIAFLYGATVEELSVTDFEYVDKDYPVIYGIKATKKR